MTSLILVDDEESTGRVNIDDLYAKKQRRDQKQLSIFNKILNRIHKRITLAGRSIRNEKHIWFTIPEYIFGEPNYDQGDCIGFIVAKLESNGFQLKYLHPNTLFVSWENWIPSYVRNEFKKKTGIIVDERGNVVDRSDDVQEETSNNTAAGKGKSQKDYVSIDKYKPTGNLVYNPEMFEKIEKRMNS